MEGLEQINYTLIEPKNTYWSDVYSPGQTKQQLEIGIEVNPPKKSKTGSVDINKTSTSYSISVRTYSRNSKIKTKAVRQGDGAISEGMVEYRIDTQKCINNEGVEVEGKIFSFSNNTSGNIEKIFPGGFILHIIKDRDERINFSFEAQNNNFS